MSRVAGTKYFMRIFISLLDGEWKSAGQIAKEWHKTGTFAENEYRKSCKGIDDDGNETEYYWSSRLKFPKSNRTDTEYKIKFDKAAEFFKDAEGFNAKLVERLLRSPNFQKFVKEKKKKLGEEDKFLKEVIDEYGLKILRKKLELIC